MGLVTPAEATERGKAAYKEALALDSNLAGVQYAVALIRTWFEWDWDGGEAAFRRATEINPNYTDALGAYSAYLAQIDRREEARPLMERGSVLDPLNPLTRVCSGFWHLYERQYAESIKESEAAQRIEPDNLVCLG